MESGRRQHPHRLDFGHKSPGRHCPPQRRNLARPAAAMSAASRWRRPLRFADRRHRRRAPLQRHFPAMATPRHMLVDDQHACDYHLASRCVRPAPQPLIDKGNYMSGLGPGPDNSTTGASRIATIRLTSFSKPLRKSAVCVSSGVSSKYRFARRISVDPRGSGLASLRAVTTAPTISERASSRPFWYSVSFTISIPSRRNGSAV